MTRMSSSTPSLPEASNDTTSTNISVASTDQAASADNLAAKVWYLNFKPSDVFRILFF